MICSEKDRRADRYILGLQPQLYIPFYRYGSEQQKAWDISMGHPEKIVNGGLESWASATDAVGWTETLVGTGTVNRDNIAPHSGTYAVRFDVSADGDNAQLSQLFYLIPGRQYKFSLWYKHTLTKTGAYIVLITDWVVGYKIDGSYDYASPGAWKELPASATYTNLTFTFTAHPDHSEYLLFLLGSEKADDFTGSIYFDDVSITPIQPESNGNHGIITGAVPAQIPMLSPINLVSNGGMELDSDWPDFLSPTTNERSNVRKYSGTYSRHIIADASDDGIIQNISNQIAGKKYKVPFWVYIESGQFIAKLFDDNDVELSYKIINTTGNWQYGEFFATPTVSGTGYIVLCAFGGAAEFYVDQVSIQEVLGYQGGLGEQCDGTDDYINCGSNPSLQNLTDLTILKWINLQNCGGGIFMGNSDYDNSGFHLNRSNNCIGFMSYDAVGETYQYSYEFPMHEWVFITLARTGTSAVWRKNLEYWQGSDDTVRAPAPSVNSFYINSGINGDYPYPKTVWGQVAVFNYGLTLQEIRNIYELTRHKYGR